MQCLKTRIKQKQKPSCLNFTALTNLFSWADFAENDMEWSETDFFTPAKLEYRVTWSEKPSRVVCNFLLSGGVKVWHEHTGSVLHSRLVLVWCCFTGIDDTDRVRVMLLHHPTKTSSQFTGSWFSSGHSLQKKRCHFRWIFLFQVWEPLEFFQNRKRGGGIIQPPYPWSSPNRWKTCPVNHKMELCGCSGSLVCVTAARKISNKDMLFNSCHSLSWQEEGHVWVVHLFPRPCCSSLPDLNCHPIQCIYSKCRYNCTFSAVPQNYDTKKKKKMYDTKPLKNWGRGREAFNSLCTPCNLLRSMKN